MVKFLLDNEANTEAAWVLTLNVKGFSYILATIDDVNGQCDGIALPSLLFLLPGLHK